MPRTGTLSRFVLGALLAVILVAAAAPAARAEVVPSPWTWTDYGPALRDVSCSSPDDCVAVGQRGMVLRSTAAAEDRLAWSRVPLEYPEELDGVTCTASFCLAVSNTRAVSATYTSKVFRSTDGGATWSAGIELPPAGPTKTRSALALACDGGGACYAVGPGGGVWRSLDQGSSWEALGLPEKPGSYDRVACPAVGTCVAAGGDTVGSSAVIEGTQVTAVDVPKKFGKGVLALACDSATRCTATDGLGHYSLLTIPSKTWSTPKLFPKAAPVSALSCPKAETCVGLSEGIAMRTTALSSATGEWHRRPIGSLNLGALDCVDDDCTAVGKAASWFDGSEVGFEWDRVNEVAKFDAIQCPAAFSGTCVAGGEKDIGVSRTGGKLWSLPLTGYSGLNVKSLNCTAKSECLFLGKTLTLFTKDLITFAERHPTTTDPKGTDAQTCVTKDICVGINEGVVYTTLDGAVTSWNENAFPDKATSVACVHGREPVECIATTREFLILGTMTHTDGEIRWHWRYTDADPPEALEAVGCSPGGQCTAVGGGGEILTSNGSDLMHWTEPIPPDLTEPVDLRPLLKSVACPADGECLAGGVHGPNAIILSTTDNWTDHSEEKIQGIEGAAPTITSFGCESADRCVAVGSTSLVGVRKP
ncbi:MAG TPA: hypothetical protein VH299_01195 [Solirubrobacterales bacterium]|nr:hypothetical protein [Solirubrobacterales bacterium]